MTQSGNLFADIPKVMATEQFADLYAAPGIRIERIVSTGQATPASEWLEQDGTEWVALLTGSAGIQFEDEPGPRTLGPGDWLAIPARQRHRVEWTDLSGTTVWLAIHVGV